MSALWRPLARPRCAVLAVLLCLLVQQQLFARAQDTDTFDCHVALDGGRQKFDLTSLTDEHTLSRTRETPPSRMLDDVRFNLCADLKRRDGVADGDQCPSGTRACMTMTNQKGDDGDRVIAVIPLAVSSALNPELSPLSSPKGLNLVFHGSSYPTTNPIPQSLNVSLLCDTSLSDPTFISYSGGQLVVEWRAPAGCEFQGEEPPSDDKSGDGEGGKGGEEEVGSGIGWFFLLLLLAFVAYFAIGAYHNYSTYGATGADLIPHRDFWREVPYILRDVASHLCSAVRPRSGYIAV